MTKNRAMVFIIMVFSVTALYSSVFFFIPLKKMYDICLWSLQVQGKTTCALNLAMPYLLFYMFLPLICAVTLQKIVYKEKLADIGFTFKWTPWYLFAWLAPIACTYLTLGISVLLPGVTFDTTLAGFAEMYKNMMTPEQLDMMRAQVAKTPLAVIFLQFTLQALVMGATLNAVFAFGEEAGWRGFLLANMKDKGFFKTVLIIGVVWGMWHFPVVIQGYNYPQHPLAGVFMMVIFGVLVTFPMVYVMYKTKSVISAAIFHGMINATGNFPVFFIKGGNDLTVGSLGAAGFAAILILNFLLFLYDRFLAKERVIV